MSQQQSHAASLGYLTDLGPKTYIASGQVSERVMSRVCCYCQGSSTQEVAKRAVRCGPTSNGPGPKAYIASIQGNAYLIVSRGDTHRCKMSHHILHPMSHHITCK